MERHADDGWFRPRRYAHFDRPLSKRAALALVTNPAAVVSHAFMPLLSVEKREPRYQRRERRVEDKIRPIACAAHADSHIYAFYAEQLKRLYEARLLYLGISPSVLAYRRFPDRKCNIHFANEAFNEAQSRGNCVAVAIDVEKFFDTLDHERLKPAWCNLLGVERLPDDHYRVFRSVTRYSKVDRDAFYNEFGLSRRQKETVSRPICTPSEFRGRVRGNGLIRTNTTGIGIPQGTPISALLSNLYMLSADVEIARYAELVGGSYRRYSDDILIISDASHIDEFEEVVMQRINENGLLINEKKTHRSNFSRDGSGAVTCDQPLPYLGFEFDGKTKRIRPRTLARYHQRVLRAIRSAQRAAAKAGRHAGYPRLKRRELYERYSHLGKRNFLRYAYRASRIMMDPTPREQLRAHWRRLNAKINSANEELCCPEPDLHLAASR